MHSEKITSIISKLNDAHTDIHQLILSLEKPEQYVNGLLDGLIATKIRLMTLNDVLNPKQETLKN